MKTSENAVVSFAIGYSRKEVELFLSSCQKCGLDADIILYAGKNYHSLKAELIDFPNVSVRLYKEPFLQKLLGKVLMKVPVLARAYAKLIRSLFRSADQGNRRFLHGFALPLIHFMGKRFFAMNQLVRKGGYDKYLFTDIRDVIMQNDPFLDCKLSEIHTGAEPIYIGDDLFNKKWVDFTFEKHRAEHLYFKKVICAGVIYGGAAPFREYLDRFIEETYEALPNIINKLGADQAIHAHLFHYDLDFVHKHIHQNHKGKIVTLHHETPESYVWVNNQIYHKSGGMIHLIHQYDRHPFMEHKLRKCVMNKERIANAVYA